MWRYIGNLWHIYWKCICEPTGGLFRDYFRVVQGDSYCLPVYQHGYAARGLHAVIQQYFLGIQNYFTWWMLYGVNIL